MSFSEIQKTSDISSILNIPFAFESQCRSALSTLLQRTEEDSTHYHYAQFSFGLLDATGLRNLLSLYQKNAAIKKIHDERKWLNRNFNPPHPFLQTHRNLLTFFASIWEGKAKNTDSIACVRNLVGTQWLSDVCVDYIANLINTLTSSTLCLVAHKETVMFCSDLMSKLHQIQLKQDNPSDVFVILNIGRKKNRRN